MPPSKVTRHAKRAKAHPAIGTCSPEPKSLPLLELRRSSDSHILAEVPGGRCLPVPYFVAFSPEGSFARHFVASSGLFQDS